jgi:membrane-bound lytic murein transglycosylase D
MRNCVWKASLYFFILSLAISAVPADAKSPENNAAEKSSDAVASLPLKAYAAFLNNADASVSFYSTDEAVYTPEIELHPFMEEFVKDYLKKNSEMLEKIKQKSDSYFSLMDKVFDKYDLPQELKYLAVIESRLKSSATSRVGAAGLWQLMPGTARVLGLKVTGTTDERRYAQKSSVAAAIYLNDLYKQFGDWLLVIAAYNSGPGGVLKAIKKSGSRDFWKLQQFLPKETRMHVKKKEVLLH